MSWNDWNNEDERSVLERWKSCYQYEINELNKNLEQMIQASLVNLRRPIDYKFWGVKSKWTLMEAAALMSNQGPREISYVKWRMVEDYLENNEYVNYRNCERLLNLLDEDSVLKVIDSCSIPTNPQALDICFKPLDVLTWAKARDIDFPEELEQKIKQIAKPTIDWENKYNEAQEEIKKLKNTLLIAPKQLNYDRSDVNNNTSFNLGYLHNEYKNPEEEVLSKKRAIVYDRIIASLAILKFPVLSDLNGSHIDSLTENNIEKFSKYFKPVSRKTLTRYLENPRKLLQLEPTEQKNTSMNK